MRAPPRTAAAVPLVFVALAILVSPGATCVATRAQTRPASPAESAARAGNVEDSLLQRVRRNIERERALLLEYVYRERRQPVRVSRFGKVSVGEEQVFEVHPSDDPDRPRRVLLEVGGRPATDEEKAEYARRYEAQRSSRTPAERKEAGEKAEARVDDAFRVFRFEMGRTETTAGRTTRVVKVLPRPDARTYSDIGKWLKKFRGQAWVSEADGELVRIEMIATDTIFLGWGFVARIGEGTRLSYVRKPVGSAGWFPAEARFELHGRTLMFRSFSVDTTTEWFDYRRQADVAAARPQPLPPR
jgi:hypothetical protein